MARKGWPKATRARWRDLLSWLALEKPLSKPVRVKRIWMRRNEPSGVAFEAGGEFVVGIHAGLSFGQAVDVLIEEWAHCGRGIDGDDRKDHDMAWGIAYSDVRNTVMEYLEEELLVEED